VAADARADRSASDDEGGRVSPRRHHAPTIRQYRRADDQQIWALASLHAAGSGEGDVASGPSPALPLPPVAAPPEGFEDLADIERDFLLAGGDFLVAEIDGHVVGTAGLLPAGRATADVVRVFVHPAVRRQGVGTALMETIEWRAEGLGVRRLNLGEGRHPKETVAFYLASGFHGLDDEEVELGQEEERHLFLSKALKVLP
jgi:GNAT superfamily N-acetyltransferase